MLLIKAGQMVGAGMATTGLAGAGVGIGLIFASLVSSLAKNPGAKNELMQAAILGFALTEAIALFTLMIAFLILFS